MRLNLNSADRLLASMCALFASWLLVTAAAGPVFVA
jgi:hypothetical protein